MKNILIADNQDLSYQGLWQLVQHLPQETGQIIRASDRLHLIGLLHRYPDSLVILDYSSFDFSATHQLEHLSARYPESRWILLVTEQSDRLIRTLGLASVSFSFISKEEKTEIFLKAFQTALSGDRFLCEHAQEVLRQKEVSYGIREIRLTQSEKEILREIALGKTTKAIAADRYLSFHTVNAHRKNIFRKLGVNNAQEAVKYGIRSGIIDPAEYYI